MNFGPCSSTRPCAQEFSLLSHRPFHWVPLDGSLSGVQLNDASVGRISSEPLSQRPFP